MKVKTVLLKNQKSKLQYTAQVLDKKLMELYNAEKQRIPEYSQTFRRAAAFLLGKPRLRYTTSGKEELDPLFKVVRKRSPRNRA